MKNEAESAQRRGPSSERRELADPTTLVQHEPAKKVSDLTNDFSALQTERLRNFGMKNGVS